MEQAREVVSRGRTLPVAYGTTRQESEWFGAWRERVLLPRQEVGHLRQRVRRCQAPHMIHVHGVQVVCSRLLGRDALRLERLHGPVNREG